MPKIKAYSGAAGLIPVAEAKIKTAYQCPWTKRLFRAKRDYVNHLADLRRTRMHAAIAYKQQEMLRNDLLGQSRFEDIIRWIEMHPDFMWRNISSKESMPLGFGIKITYLSLTYDAHASNTHGAPRGGVTNWERAATDKSGKPLPTGYPAWTGRIEFTITGEKSPTHYWSSDVMKKLGIHTGSGGGISGNRYGFGVTFWADDWPTLKMMRALKDDESLGHVRIGKADYFK